MERIIFQKGGEQAHQIGSDWVKDFKLKSSGNCTFDIGKRLF